MLYMYVCMYVPPLTQCQVRRYIAFIWLRNFSTTIIWQACTESYFMFYIIKGEGDPKNSQICADILYGWLLLRTAEGRSKTYDLLLDQNQTQHGADTFYKCREISISYGCLGLHKEQFNFKKFLDNKQVPYCLEFIQVGVHSTHQIKIGWQIRK